MQLKKSIMTLTLFAILSLLTTSIVSAANTPMLNKYVEWNYGDSSKYFSGFIPALNKRVPKNPWELYRWTGVFNFKDDSSSSVIRNYDVFNVKDTPDEPSFKKENGFGLVYKSPEALGDLFDAVWAGQTLGAKQRAYFRENFVANADDPIFKNGHDYYYLIQQRFEFLRTAGIISRMGGKFDQTQKVGEDDYQAIYEVSKWPTLKVTKGDALSINFTSSGYSERNIRLIAAPKGAFPNLNKVVSLTNGKLIKTTDETYKGSVKVNSKDISKVLGPNVDIIIDDGYGRTAIESVKLPDDQQIDYVPTKLSLTESGQLWVKFRYDGEDLVTSDYLDKRGMPMDAAVKVGGATKAEFSLPSMDDKLPNTLKKGQEMNYMLGKVEISNTPGKYYIKVDAAVNDPNHPDRGLEAPSEAYKNNMIHGEWVIERKGAENDLIAQSITATPSSIQQGGQSAITAKVKNVGATDLSNVLIRFQDNGKTIYEARKAMKANNPVSVGPFSWTGSTVGVHNLSVTVDPEQEFPDSNRSNNVATTGCSVIGLNGDSPGECNKAKVDGSWTVSYPLITGYPTKTRTVTWTDSKGKSHSSTESYTDYSDPIWETRNVKYTEQLNIEPDVSTKQGIKTDLDHPKDSDRHSRGSWEIIPYAKKNGKDPDNITRAGYGFELSVRTKYSTDWEEKVPVGLEGTAKPIGGKYYGPDQVYVLIYDSNKKFAKKIELERTKGDRNNATWELPEVTTKSLSGKTYKDRKFFTDVDAPDGYYTIKILSSSAGMTGLTVCATKKVEIYGSMYDDTQNLRVVK
ncbi:CARDB domain-containing protein [Paenibacillus puldeungensis]|uniref:CARDB domain-containing protein n=1 Tax=Paenibacillus puldeungensis TaxID=696536 RepID=A0ABW3S5G7_9BACL